MINNYFILIIVIYLAFTDNENKHFDWLGGHRNNILDKPMSSHHQSSLSKLTGRSKKSKTTKKTFEQLVISLNKIRPCIYLTLLAMNYPCFFFLFVVVLLQLYAIWCTIYCKLERRIILCFQILLIRGTFQWKLELHWSPF